MEMNAPDDAGWGPWVAGSDWSPFVARQTDYDPDRDPLYFYRLRKPSEPKVETVTLCHIMFVLSGEHTITFKTIDGQPDCASIKMEPLK
jgi:hypothetical protein